MSPIVNTAQLASLLRTLAQAACAYALGKGWIKPDDVAGLVTLIVTLGLTGYGVYVRRNAALVASAAAVPSVVAILADAATAAAVENDKVQPAA